MNTPAIKKFLAREWLKIFIFTILGAGFLIIMLVLDYLGITNSGAEEVGEEYFFLILVLYAISQIFFITKWAFSQLKD